MTRNVLRGLGATGGFLAAFFLVLSMLPPKEMAARTVFLAPESRSNEPVTERVIEPVAPVVSAAVVESASLAAEAPPEPGVEESSAQVDELGVLVHGVVTDEDGAPISEAFVFTRDSSGAYLQAPTDELGRYSLAGLSSGPRLLTGRKGDYHDDEVSLELGELEPLVRVDFTLAQQQIIWVRMLTTEGQATYEALNELEPKRPTRLDIVPVATRENPGATFDEIFGSHNNPFGVGRYMQAGMYRTARGPGDLGTVTLLEDGPAWLNLVVANQVLRQERVDESTEEVTFVVDVDDLIALECGIRARILDAATGEPAPGFVVLCDDPFPNGRRHTIGDDGWLELEGQAPGERWFVVQADERARHAEKVTLSPGDVHELGDILVHRPVQLSGRVQNASGDPVAAVLRWGRLDPGTGEVSWAQQTRGQSQPDGTFTLPGLNPDLYVVQAPGFSTSPRGGHPGHVSLAQRADARDGSVDDLVIELLDTAAVTLVTEDVVEPWPHVEVLDPSGLPIASAWPGRWGPETFVHLPPGRFVMVTRRDGVELERRELVVDGEDQRLELDFD